MRLTSDLLGRSDAVELGHPDIHKNDVRSRCRHKSDGLTTVRCLSDHSDLATVRTVIPVPGEHCLHHSHAADTADEFRTWMDARSI